MPIRKVTLVFPQEQIKEPVVFTMAKKFDVVPNIRRARVTESVGEMTLELEGKEDALKQAVRFLESKGIKVESVIGDSVI